MRHVLLIVAFLLGPVSLTSADSTTPDVIDGDTLFLDNQKLGLYGIDAPEIGQPCKIMGKDEYWDCGKKAADVLRSLVADGITCEPIGNEPDDRGRHPAICHHGPYEINAEMIVRGYAVTDHLAIILDRQGPAYDYSVLQDAAERLERGIWSGRFESPAIWRRRQE